MTPSSTRVCFVCLGNICRSPIAAAIMTHLVAQDGRAHAIVVDSAGTGGWHAGDGPDRRAAAEVRRRGVAIDHVARQFTTTDFDRFDLILAMDLDNRRDLMALAPTAAAAGKVRLVREFDTSAPPAAIVPDPYYGGPEGFAEVYDQLERACRGLLEQLVA